MSVMLPQLSKAIMSICSALFIETLSMFSHETPDPSNQSLLSRALGTNFMTSTAAAALASEILKEGGKNVNF